MFVEILRAADSRRQFRAVIERLGSFGNVGTRSLPYCHPLMRLWAAENVDQHSALRHRFDISMGSEGGLDIE